MKRLEHLLPFLTLLIVLALLFMMTGKSYGSALVSNQSLQNNKICSFKLATDKIGHLKKLIPPGTYRIVGERSQIGFTNGGFQKLEINHHRKFWKTLGQTEGGKRLTVNLKNNRDNLYLYFNENKSRPGSCVLEGSMHSWI